MFYIIIQTTYLGLVCPVSCKSQCQVSCLNCTHLMGPITTTTKLSFYDYDSPRVRHLLSSKSRLLPEQLPLESSHPEPGGRCGGGGVCELQQLRGGEGGAGGLQEVSLGLLKSLGQELNSLVKRGFSLHQAGELLLSAGGISRVDNVSSDNNDLGAGWVVQKDGHH